LGQQTADRAVFCVLCDPLSTVVGGVSMLSDLLLIGIAVSMIVACIYGLKSKYRVLAAIALLIISIPVLFTLMINLPNIFSPFTPVVYGKVIDADSKKPLAGINIKAGWLVGASSVGGGGGGYYKFYKTVTDANGEFKLPRGIKTITTQFPPFIPLIDTKFAGINIVASPNGYDYMVTTEQIKTDNKVTISLERVNSDTDFLENIRLYWRWLSGMHKGNGNYMTDENERKWLRQAYRQFEVKYTDSKADEPMLEQISNWLNSNNDPECVYVTDRLVNKYPKYSWNAKSHLEYLRDKYKIK
jgi:hypothetical protein